MPLVLGRRPGEGVLIGDDILLRIVSIQGKQVKISIAAPDNIKILREELAGQPYDYSKTITISNPQNKDRENP